MVTTTESPAPANDIGGRVYRIADLSVLIVVVVALIGGVLLREMNVNATQTASFEGVSFAVPKGALTKPVTNGYAATTDGGLTVRVEKLPAPPAGVEDVGALIATRALQLGGQRPLFQSTGTNEVQVGGKNAGLLEYQYVESNSDKLFVSGMRIIDGRELLIPNAEAFYAVSLEGPSDKSAELNALWPRIQSSVRLEG